MMTPRIARLLVALFAAVIVALCIQNPSDRVASAFVTRALPAASQTTAPA